MRERGRQAGKKGDRKCCVFLKEGIGERSTRRETDKERQTTRAFTNLFTLTHCASERKRIASPLIYALL